MDWLQENADALGVLASIGTLLVWVIYLQVFLRSYRRQRKAMILINLGEGSGLAAHCLVANMSADPIYIHALIVRLEGPDGALSSPVTELDEIENWQEPSDLRLWTRQGPLLTGQVRDMGTIDTFVDHVRRWNTERGRPDGSPSERRRIEIYAIAAFASEDLLVAAKRCYDVTHDQEEPALSPANLGTEQIRSRRRRRRLVATLHQTVAPTASPQH